MQVSMLRGMAIGANAVVGLALIAPSASAQAQNSGTRFGVEAAYGTQSIGFGVGAFVKFHLAEISEHAITGRVAFDYYFPGSSYCGAFTGSCGYKYFEIAGDGLFDITNPKSDIKPYVGAGLTWAHSSFGSDFCGGFGGSCPGASTFGLDVVGGINFMADKKLMPFVEVKLDARSGGAFIIKGGIHF